MFYVVGLIYCRARVCESLYI